MKANHTDPSSAYEISSSARQLLAHLYSKYRDSGDGSSSYGDIAKNLPLTEPSVDEAATELSVCGYVRLIRFHAGGALVLIQDAGRVEASRGQQKPKHWLARLGSWLLDHIVATILGGVIVAVLLAWIGLGKSPDN